MPVTETIYGAFSQFLFELWASPPPGVVSRQIAPRQSHSEQSKAGLATDFQNSLPIHRQDQRLVKPEYKKNA